MARRSRRGEFALPRFGFCYAVHSFWPRFGGCRCRKPRCAADTRRPDVRIGHPCLRHRFRLEEVKARAARKLGARFAASYLSTAASKDWTRAMIHAYHAAGLATVCVWETSATRALARYAAGRTDARAALIQEQALGVPAWKPIYFAVDFNENADQARAVASYYRGVNAVLGVKRTGAYGGYWTIRRLFKAGLIRFGWQTSVWSGGRWDRRAQLQQYACYSAYDWDRAMTSAYGATYK